MHGLMGIGRIGLLGSPGGRPTLGPDLFPSSPTTFGAPNWLYADRVFVKNTTSSIWGGANDVIPAQALEYEVSLTVTGHNGAGGIFPALADNTTSANHSSLGEGITANGTYVYRATSNASNQALAFFSGAGKATVTINYLKRVH